MLWNKKTKRKPLELLTDAEIKEAPSFIPVPRMGRCYRVYDGDTINVVAYDGDVLKRYSVRVNGIDTPEIRGKTDEEKKLAQKAKVFATEFALGKVVELRNHGKEKYGRVLADVFVEGMSLKDALISANLGREYDGGHKIPW